MVTLDSCSSTVGLTSASAAARLAADGPNALPPPVERSALRRLVAQLVHFFAVMLWVAAALAFVAGIPELGAAIALVIVLNALFAFFQENRAGQAAARLRALLPMQVTVVRDGRRQQVDSAQVVVGDVLALEGGDRTPADARLLAAHGLLVDTSLLTGESEPVRSVEGDVISAGTFVVEGEALALVSATGRETRLADIAALTTGTDPPPSPLTLELRRVVRTVAAIAVSVGATFFVVMVIVGRPVSDGLVLAIGVMVALVPEALLPTVMLSLAWGAEQMAHRRGDWQAHGDPMEVAIDVFARRLGLASDHDRELEVTRARFPFDPRRRRMSVVVGDDLFVKGAPDAGSSCSG